MVDQDRTLEEFLQQIKDLPGISASDLQELRSAVEEGEPSEIPPSLVDGHQADPASPQLAQADSLDMRVQLGKMTIPQKIKAALFGNGTCRGLLVLDPNKVISLAVLRNAKLTIGEVEDFAKSTSMPDYILRNIAANSQWVRSYKLKLHLVMNSKTPQDVSMRWLKHLNSFDLKRVAQSRNVPQLISSTARKVLADQKE